MTDPWFVANYERVREHLPELTRLQFSALAEALGLWLNIKADSEPRWTEEQRQCLRQLSPDVWHSGLLVRMLVERKPPLPKPPPLDHSYPVYPADDG